MAYDSSMVLEFYVQGRREDIEMVGIQNAALTTSQGQEGSYILSCRQTSKRS